MNHILSKTKTYLFIVTILTGFSLVSCNDKSMNGMLIATRIPAGETEEIAETIFLNLPESELIAVHPDDAEVTVTELTQGFYSACSPNLSYDGRKILFAGQKNSNDNWQVWEMDLIKKQYKQITHFDASCYTPFYLPGKQIVFSKEVSDSLTGMEVKMLFTLNLDGTNLRQITYHPHNDYIQTILRDGRILMHSRQLYPEKGNVKTLAMRPNGTKAEIFYRGNSETQSGIRFCETKNGTIYFTETDDKNPDKRNLVSIHQDRPLNTKTNYSENTVGSFYSLFPKSEEEIFVSYRPSKTKNIGLYKFSVSNNTVEKALLNDNEYHYLEPVYIQSYKRPRDLPNELMEDYPTGLIMCQDVNLTAQTDNPKNQRKATKIEVLGIDKSLGIVEVEEDGSFFLKITADLPFRFQTLDENNEVVNEPSDWLWIRPFERRGCVGCHEDHELAPQNVVPMAVNKWPVLIPADSLNQETNQKTFELGDMH